MFAGEDDGSSSFDCQPLHSMIASSSLRLTVIIGLSASWLAGLTPGSVSAQTVPPPAASWDQVYDPAVVRSLNIQLSEEDWNTVQSDLSFSLEKAALFWADGEEKTFTGLVRRKSATALGEKISYKFDFGSTPWHDLKNLSLENGDDNNVVSEGFSWLLHRLASNQNYRPSLAAWATLTVHVERPQRDPAGNVVVDDTGTPLTWIDVRPQGLYLNVEQPDKKFLAHRGLWNKETSFFYKQDDIGLPERKETATGGDSPAYLALGYAPFQVTRTQGKKTLNPTPSDAVLETDLRKWINMDSMLRLGVVNAYVDNPDELFNKGKNYFWIDYAVSSTADFRRLYFPWDLDASVRSTSSGIYGKLSTTVNRKGQSTVSVSQHPYQSVILNHSKFRAQYNAVFSELINGPLVPTNLQNLISDIQDDLTPHLLNDPNNQIGTAPEQVAGFFDFLRAWVVQRDASVRHQWQQNGPPAPRSAY